MRGGSPTAGASSNSQSLPDDEEFETHTTTELVESTFRSIYARPPIRRRAIAGSVVFLIVFPET